MILLQMPQDFFCGKGFEVMDLLPQIGCLQDTVHVIFQNHITIDLDAPVLLPEDEPIQNDLHRTRSGKNGQPVEHGKGQEMGCAGVCYGVATAADDVSPLKYCCGWFFSPGSSGSHAVHPVQNLIRYCRYYLGRDVPHPVEQGNGAVSRRIYPQGRESHHS
jgi:hypothetical protein